MGLQVIYSSIMIINSLYINRIYYVLYYNGINTNNVKIQLLYIDPNINDHIIVRRIILIIHILYILYIVKIGY